MTIKEFDQWKEDYGLEYEPNYSLHTEMDCLNAFKAGQQSKQQEIDRLKAIITEALAVYDRPICDETDLYQRDDDIWHILTEDKFI